jgi:lipopolysaccharide/colanic/teichoic acid biosynthesis glycosyltransferase
MSYESTLKRGLDLLIAVPALLAVSPILLLTATAILLEDGRPILFRQVRVGRHNRNFRILKFRSMPVATPSVPSAAAGAFKVTRVGAVIRRTNIDELPQLVNVLRGEMSIVGPRPGLPVQEKLMALRRARGVDRLRPGLTGLAQVNSFDGMTDEQKVEWEARYADHVSFAVDLGVILRTFAYLLRRPPVY